MLKKSAVEIINCNYFRRLKSRELVTSILYFIDLYIVGVDRFITYKYNVGTNMFSYGFYLYLTI